jgi:hypothetical protein
MYIFDSGHANAFIGLKGVYKPVYLSMSEKLPVLLIYGLSLIFVEQIMYSR